jgi:hypothetical protein
MKTSASMHESPAEQARRAPARLRERGLSAADARLLGSDLPWRRVAEAANDVHVAPAVRWALDEALADRAAALSAGERIALAAIAPAQTRGALRTIGIATPALLEKLLANPRTNARERRGIARELETMRSAS